MPSSRCVLSLLVQSEGCLFPQRRRSIPFREIWPRPADRCSHPEMDLRHNPTPETRRSLQLPPVANDSWNDLSKAAIDSARSNFLVSRDGKLGSSGWLSGDSMKTGAVIRGQRLAVAAVSLFGTASIAFAGTQKMSTKSIQLNPDPLETPAMRHIETDKCTTNA